MQTLGRHLLNKDWEMLGKTAHKLKSSVGNLGLNDLRDLFLYIEQNCKEGTNLDQLPSYVQKTVAAVDQLFLDIEVEIARLKAL